MKSALCLLWLSAVCALPTAIVPEVASAVEEGINAFLATDTVKNYLLSVSALQDLAGTVISPSDVGDASSCDVSFADNPRVEVSEKASSLYDGKAFVSLSVDCSSGKHLTVPTTFTSVVRVTDQEMFLEDMSMQDLRTSNSFPILGDKTQLDSHGFGASIIRKLINTPTLIKAGAQMGEMLLQVAPAMVVDTLPSKFTLTFEAPSSSPMDLERSTHHHHHNSLEEVGNVDKKYANRHQLAYDQRTIDQHRAQGRATSAEREVGQRVKAQQAQRAERQGQVDRGEVVEINTCVSSRSHAQVLRGDEWVSEMVGESVKVGDKVLTQDGVGEVVFNKCYDEATTVVSIGTDLGIVSMTPTHMLAVRRGESVRFEKASSVEVGDVLIGADGQSVPVTSVSADAHHTCKLHTTTYTTVLDGVVVSNFVDSGWGHDWKVFLYKYSGIGFYNVFPAVAKHPLYLDFYRWVGVVIGNMSIDNAHRLLISLVK